MLHIKALVLLLRRLGTNQHMGIVTLENYAPGQPPKHAIRRGGPVSFENSQLQALASIAHKKGNLEGQLKISSVYNPLKQCSSVSC
jgi:hypothetical protein